MRKKRFVDCVLEFEDFCSDPERGISREIARSIVELASVDTPRGDMSVFDRKRSMSDKASGEYGLAILALPLCKKWGGNLPELLRIAVCLSETSERVFNAVTAMKPVAERVLFNTIKMQDKKPVAEEAPASPKSGVRATPPPPSQSEPRIAAIADSASA